jgi:phospholipase C
MGLVACGSHASSLPSGGFVPTANAAHSVTPGTYIKHVVIVIQENRSFENIFAGFPNANAPMTGYTSTGAKVKLTAGNFMGSDMPHGWTAAMAAWNKGKMNGFDRQLQQGSPVGARAYEYLARNLVAPYWAMAHRYVLADAMFPTEFGASFTSHIDLIASTDNLSPTLGEVDWPSAGPWGCDAPQGTWSWTLTPDRVEHRNGPYPCFDQFHTMADTLDAANVSWKYYQSTSGLWSAFNAIRNVREVPTEWAAHVVQPQTQVLTDAANGNLASVSWVVPDNADSDHPGSNSDTGPSWVASVVNAVGKGPEWNSTAVIVLWDDWGGWYDNAAPKQKDFVGLGIRVPAIIISPYVKPHVSHTNYEFGSILKFVEQTFGLPPVGPASFGYTDTRAHSLIDSFDFTQAPRPYKMIPAKYKASYFLTRKAPVSAYVDYE